MGEWALGWRCEGGGGLRLVEKGNFGGGEGGLCLGWLYMFNIRVTLH